jgi:adenylate cyclase
LEALIEDGLGARGERRHTAGTALDRSMKRRVSVTLATANVLGAALVFVFLSWVVPTPVVRHNHQLTMLNLVVFLAMLPVGLAAGVFFSLRVARRVRDWVREGRAPDAREREATLRQPLLLTAVDAAGWVIAAVLFGAINAPYSLALGFEVAATILLGGLATCALGYLLAERLLRPQTAIALAAGAPEKLVRPGVATRMLLAWAFGTGIAVVGTLLVAAAFLADGGVSPRRLAGTVLFLSAVALLAGLTTAFMAARSVADPVESVRRALAEVGHGNVAVEVPVYDGSEVGQLQAGFNRMVAELRERDRLRDLFGRHVGEEVAREALARGVELGGETRVVSVLFVDVIGSTGFAETHPPEEVVEALNRFFALVIEVVTSHGGWINKFEGDAALCVFGAPAAHPAAATAALAAARTLRDRLPAVVPELPAAVGVSAGPVVAGHVGAAERFEYTVIGDAVNEAARLTELAKESPARLLASESIVAAADAAEANRWTLGEQVRLRGRAAPTTLATPA